jgi:sugar/nucleoside kinase (ribokinase family)
MVYDLVFVGHYTKDTIVSAAGTRTVDGGAVYYGAAAAARLGLRVGVVTRLAEEDGHVLRGLEKLGVKVFATVSASSTCLKLVYPGDDPDQREIYVTGRAEPLSARDVAGLEAQAFLVGSSIRDELEPGLLDALGAKAGVLCLDVQGFARVVREGRLCQEPWPRMAALLSGVGVLKADAVEAELLTGCGDQREAALALQALGPEEVLVTRSQGVLVRAGDAFYQAPFLPRRLVGRSGRGDTCIAAYMAHRLNAPPAEAVMRAAAVASLKMESDGPFRGDGSQVEDFIRERYGLA